MGMPITPSEIPPLFSTGNPYFSIGDPFSYILALLYVLLCGIFCLFFEGECRIFTRCNVAVIYNVQTTAGFSKKACKKESLLNSLKLIDEHLRI